MRAECRPRVGDKAGALHVQVRRQCVRPGRVRDALIGRRCVNWRCRPRSAAEHMEQHEGTMEIPLIARKTGRNPAARRPTQGLGRGRKRRGFVAATVLPPLLQVILGMLPHDQLSTDMLVQLTGVVAVALLGGLRAALIAAVLAVLCVNYWRVRPVGSLVVIDPENVLALLVFLAVAISVSMVVDRSARLGREARMAAAEAALLADLSRRAVAGDQTISGFLEQVRAHFGVDGAAVWIRGGVDAPDSWVLREHVGAIGPGAVHGADAAEDLDAGRVLTLTGRDLSPDERRLLAAFAAHLLAMLQREELSASQRENLRLAEGNKMRTSILRAVSHDLRTPLAGIKLASSSLRDGSIRFSPEEQEELLATIEAGADRLDRLVSNLLDMSRITADSVSPLTGPVHWADVVAEAIRGADPARIRVLLPDNMPPVEADPGMLERVIANIVENALKYAPESDVIITGAVGGAGESVIDGVPAGGLTMLDHGAGIPAGQVSTMFRPFQRADDTTPGTGIGLGLAVAKGFTEAMGGVLLAEPTPGGGLTMVIRLPLSTGRVPEFGLEGHDGGRSHRR
jgi:two-component system sensor histidine kinase KdpD